MVISQDDALSLLQIATDHIKTRYTKNRHHVGCVLMANGQLYKTSHLDIVGGLDVCAEPIAVSNAIADGSEDFEALVTVAWNGDSRIRPWVIPPCGNCRQVLIEYAPNLGVIIEAPGLKIVSMRDLIPHPYTKR